MGIAFFGMGLLGSNFVRAFRRRGESVAVYNRTLSKAQALESVGATVHADPAEAVRGVTRLHLALSDDAAVDDLLERARPSLPEGVFVVDHTTTSAHGTRARAERWRSRGVKFVHAPVFMGPQNALESTGLMLVSGERALVTAITPVLATMTGKVVDLGDRVDQAAAMKLLGNLFLMFVTQGLADVLTLARAMEVDPASVRDLFGHFNPGTTLVPRLDRMLGGEFAKPSWELSMARKDAGLMLDEAARASLPLAALPAIAARMDAMIERGHGHDDWTVLAKDALVSTR